MTDTTAGEDTRRDAAAAASSHARSAMERAAVEIAAANGAEVAEEHAWPGSLIMVSRTEPLAGIRAAGVLRNLAARIEHGYIRRARERGDTWQEIGTALGLDAAAHELGERAFEHVTDAEHAERFAGLSFAWTCPGCGELVSDRGPYESHPEDNERGHGDGCTRMAAALRAHELRMSAWDDE